MAGGFDVERNSAPLLLALAEYLNLTALCAIGTMERRLLAWVMHGRVELAIQITRLVCGESLDDNSEIRETPLGHCWARNARTLLFSHGLVRRRPPGCCHGKAHAARHI